MYLTFFCNSLLFHFCCSFNIFFCSLSGKSWAWTSTKQCKKCSFIRVLREKNVMNLKIEYKIGYYVDGKWECIVFVFVSFVLKHCLTVSNIESEMRKQNQKNKTWKKNMRQKRNFWNFEKWLNIYKTICVFLFFFPLFHSSFSPKKFTMWHRIASWLNAFFRRWMEWNGKIQSITTHISYTNKKKTTVMDV